MVQPLRSKVLARPGALPGILAACALAMSACHPPHGFAMPALPPGIAGQVVDAQGEPLPGVEVQASAGQGLRQVITSDDQGRFRLEYLLTEGGERQPLSRGQQVELILWKPGLEPQALHIPFPGAQLVLEPVALQAEEKEAGTEALPALQEASPASVQPANSRSGRGE